MVAMTRALLLAPAGMVGRAFASVLDADADVTWEGLDRTRLDLADEASVARFDPAGVDVVVCCAAHTAVDAAESEEALATRINGAAVGALAERCAAAGATLIHFSTDYVFDGQGTAPYPVDAPIAPLNAYGRSKAAGERAIAASGADHLLVRTSWVYAPWGKNFVLTMAKLTQTKDALKVVDDQRGRPTSAEHLARTTWALYRQSARGTFHVTDGGECTWYELASHVRDVVGATCAIAPCTTADFPTPATRPSYSVLDLSRTEALVGPMPPWRANVRDALSSS
ncbi:MAG: dTDP-4-dehydrorhamnose reductase [Sandaracinus sp.]|nr:dTDP-4-dehydrorhamnose reductase [Sandaracinus sp.]